EEQERELHMKAQVIERQSRLELAAQTAGQAAHDIQDLLSPLVIHLDRLARKNLSVSQIQQTVDTLKANASGVRELNGQLLALARRGRVEREPVSISLLIEEVMRQLPSLVPLVQVEIEAELWIQGSRTQLRRAMFNTLTNAFEASEGKAPIQLHARRL